ncbi:MAG TPA: hypothetical protein VKU19_07480 [Bryobacteraceae bacterium]|nr:hypothetical protein [Bryobacteraceae bacterium]
MMINYIGAACSVFLNYKAGAVPDDQAFVLALWLFRYLRRREAFVGSLGEGGALTDKVARDLLFARNRAEDLVVTTLPDWDSAVHDLARRWIGNAYHGKHLDIKNLTEPHGYGPSLRRLWVEARNHGHDPWGIIGGWALHMPKSFQDYDPDEFFERWKKGPHKALREELSPKENKQVSRVLAKRIEWRPTGNFDIPWIAEDRQHTYRVRLNNFPDEWMYGLLVDETEAGDFHDWPDTWKRGPHKTPAESAAGRKPKTSAQAVVEIDPGRLVTRYRNGDHEGVWSDLDCLGGRVREPRYLEPARAVARETMQRARRNVETIVRRLHEMNYRFSVWEPKAAQRGDRPFVPAAADAAEQLRKLERDGMVLPLSLEAWVEQVGSVNLMGAHPKLCFLGDEEDFPYLFADPLMVDVSLEHIAGEDASDGIDYVIALDDEGKAGGATLHPGYYKPDFYFVRLPDLHADTKLRGERHKINFVSYLRLAFRWGGFPGWEQYDERPEKELTALSSGLLAI